jgi:hypothetical protein
MCSAGRAMARDSEHPDVPDTTPAPVVAARRERQRVSSGSGTSVPGTGTR